MFPWTAKPHDEEETYHKLQEFNYKRITILPLGFGGSHTGENKSYNTDFFVFSIPVLSKIESG